MADVGHNGRGGILKRSPALANPGALLHIPVDGCGCSSGVEHHVANVRVVGSNPIARSNRLRVRPGDLGAIFAPSQPATDDIGDAGRPALPLASPPAPTPPLPRAGPLSPCWQ